MRLDISQISVEKKQRFLVRGKSSPTQKRVKTIIDELINMNL